MKTTTRLASTEANSGSFSAGQGRYVTNKWRLLKAIEDIRETLGLKGTSLALLRAMLSFVHSDEVTADREDAHICFASNAALAKRAHVSVQTVERHIAKLVELGLLVRKPSGNGKRWARRDADGRIVLATGLSLLPLARRYSEFVSMAQAQDVQSRDLKLLRDRCMTALSSLKSIVTDSDVCESLTARARNLLRRKPNKDALNALLVDINEEIRSHSQSKTAKLRGTDLNNEGHKETNLNPSVEDKSSNSIDVDSAQMETAYPRLCTELRFARSADACHRQMDELAVHLALGDVWFSIRDLGPAQSFMVLGYILERIETIKSPKAYAKTLLLGLREKQLDWRTLLKRPKPREIHGFRPGNAHA